jgi:catechol 2,3-dioxygenase-like lactoylglutathione lyase family enzyme
MSIRDHSTASRIASMHAMLSIGSVVIRVEDLERQKAFWTAVLDYVPREGDDDTWALLRPRNGQGPNVSLDRWHAPVQVRPKIHLDLYADDQAAEVERLMQLDARRHRAGRTSRRSSTAAANRGAGARHGGGWTRRSCPVAAAGRSCCETR